VLLLFISRLNVWGTEIIHRIIIVESLKTVHHKLIIAVKPYQHLLP